MFSDAPLCRATSAITSKKLLRNVITQCAHHSSVDHVAAETTQGNISALGQTPTALTDIYNPIAPIGSSLHTHWTRNLFIEPFLLILMYPDYWGHLQMACHYLPRYLSAALNPEVILFINYHQFLMEME